jgi:hypothetical protein
MERMEKIAAAYAHDYRNMNLSESGLEDVITQAIMAYQCQHSCTSNCRREGCRCECGDSHF